MVVHEIRCPSEEAVDDYLAARLGTADRDGFEQHLDRCEDCRGLVAELARVNRSPATAGTELAVHPAPSSEIRLGSVVADTYRLEEYLGRGGFGAVYRARHTRLPREVAVKIVSAILLDEPIALARFENEAKLACSLSHEHIVQVFDFNRTASGHPYIVMELLHGENLSERLERGPLTVAQTTRIVGQIGDALDLIHARGIIHRDLKPANIFLCEGRSEIDARLLDFGLAKALDMPGVTKTGLIVGTPRYMSPEQIRKEEDRIGPGADVFALGTIIYECLTTKHAFEGRTLLEVLESVCHIEPDPICALNPAVPPDVARVLARALCKSPAERYQSAASLVADLQRACGSQVDSQIEADFTSVVVKAPPRAVDLGRADTQFAQSGEQPTTVAEDSGTPTTPVEDLSEGETQIRGTLEGDRDAELGAATLEVPAPVGAPSLDLGPRNFSPATSSLAPSSPAEPRTLVGRAVITTVALVAVGLMVGVLAARQSSEPTPQPASQRTPQPTSQPTVQPTSQSTVQPTVQPTSQPTGQLTPATSVVPDAGPVASRQEAADASVSELDGSPALDVVMGSTQDAGVDAARTRTSRSKPSRIRKRSRPKRKERGVVGPVERTLD